MKRFESYPIYINHPGHWAQVRADNRYDAADRGDFKNMTWWDTTGKRLYEIKEETSPDREVREYENQVLQLLRLIGSTRVGRLLFDSLDRTNQYWIVPMDDEDKAEWQVGAQEFPGAPNEGGGERVYFNPKDFHMVGQSWNSGADILMHEMVHAYRCGRVGYASLNQKFIKGFTSAEEFFALQMQNMFLANRHSVRFYLTYSPTRAGSKDEAYQYFASDPEVLTAFRHFVYRDPLAAEVSDWTQPPDSFNPFRDQRMLEQRYIANNKLTIDSLPAF
jgi:hypothetical protein